MTERYCSEVRFLHPDAPDCCGSCHDDWELGYADHCEIEIDGVTYLVCCKLMEYLNDI